MSAIEIFNGRLKLNRDAGGRRPLFTTAIQSLGGSDSLILSVESSISTGTVIIFVFSAGGTAIFYAVIELIQNIADKASVDGILILLQMQMITNLAKAILPFKNARKLLINGTLIFKKFFIKIIVKDFSEVKKK